MEALRLEHPEIPPGQDDLPSEFGPPMESEQHRANMNILVESLRLAWAERDDYYIAGNMALYFSELQVRKNDFLGPDVFVALGTENKPRKSWVVWQEGKAPDLVIELLSASTEENDRGQKMQIYARALRVPEYYLFDPLDGRFEGFSLDARGLRYVPMQRESDGGYASALLGLRLAPRPTKWLGEVFTMLRWVSPDGVVLPSPQEAAEAAQAQAHAAQAQARAQAARADQLAARLRALGIDPDL